MANYKIGVELVNEVSPQLKYIQNEILDIIPKLDEATAKFKKLGGTDINLKVDDTEIEKARKEAKLLDDQLKALAATRKKLFADMSKPAKGVDADYVTKAKLWSKETNNLIAQHERLNNILQKSGVVRRRLEGDRRKVVKETPQTSTELTDKNQRLMDLDQKIKRRNDNENRLRAKNADIQRQANEGIQREQAAAEEQLAKRSLATTTKTENQKTAIVKKGISERTTAENKATIHKETIQEKCARAAANAPATSTEADQQHKKAIEEQAKAQEKNASAINTSTVNTKNLDAATKDFSKTSNEISKQMEVTRKLQQGDEKTKTQGYAKQSQQYQLLQKDLQKMDKIQQMLGSDELRIRERGYRAWQKHRDIIQDNTKKIGMMSRQMGFMNSGFAKFSIIMSGMAATLFVFQTIRQVISSIVGVGLNLDKAMTNIRLETKLTAQEFANIEANAKRIGKTGFMKQSDYVAEIQQMKSEGIPLEAAESLIDQMQKAKAAMEEGTVPGVLTEFSGVMNQFADALYRSADSPFISVLRTFNAIAGPLVEKMGKNGAVETVAVETAKKTPIGLVWEHHPFFKFLREITPAFKSGLESTLGSKATDDKWGRTKDATDAGIREIQNLFLKFHDLGLSTNDATITLPKFTGELEGLNEIIRDASKAYGVQEDLIYRIIKAESGFRPKIVNEKSGATGLMQVLPSTGKEMGYDNMLDMRQNVMAGTKYMSIQKKRFGSDQLASAAYNAGPERVKEYKGVPPFPETIKYLDKIYGPAAKVNVELKEMGERSIKTAEQLDDFLTTLSPSAAEAVKKSYSTFLDSAFKLTGRTYRGQFEKQDTALEAKYASLQIGNASPADQKAVRDRDAFERQQYELGPAMTDYEEAYAKLGKTENAYWLNEHAQLQQHLKELRHRNVLTEEQIKIIEELGKTSIEKKKQKPYMETLDTLATATGTVPKELQAERIKDANREFEKYIRTLKSFGEYRDSWNKNDMPLSASNERLIAYGKQLSSLRIEIDALAPKMANLQQIFADTGDLSQEMVHVDQLKVLNDYLGDLSSDVDPGLAAKAYETRMDNLKTKYIDPSVSAYETMYSTVGGFSDDYYEKRLLQIESESRHLADMSKDAVAAKKWEIEQKRLLEAQRLENTEGGGVVEGIQAGHLRLLNENQTVAERVSRTWIDGANDLASAWDSVFFDFMTVQFDNLGESAVNVFRSIQHTVVGILNDIVKEAMQKMIMSGLTKLIGGAVGSAFTGTTEGYSSNAITGSLNSTGYSDIRRAAGGMITEPVVGIGTRSGRKYEIGEAGPEMVLPLSKMSGKGSGNVNLTSPGVDIVINNNTGAEVKQQEQQSPGGKRQVMLTIGHDIGAGGPTARAMERRYGLVPKGSRIYS